MTDRPILFSAPMVRALLEGRKTQTRRLINPQLIELGGLWDCRGALGGEFGTPPEKAISYMLAHVRFRVGDRLWVREAWRVAAVWNNAPPRDLLPGTALQYDEGGMHARTGAIADAGKLRPGMFLPRWASRLTLTVSDVRVQRLQEIDAADAIAEGVRFEPGDSGPIAIYAGLWDSLNAKRAPWSSNPWVVAVTFDVAQRNIDQLGEGSMNRREFEREIMQTLIAPDDKERAAPTRVLGGANVPPSDDQGPALHGRVYPPITCHACNDTGWVKGQIMLPLFADDGRLAGWHATLAATEVSCTHCEKGRRLWLNGTTPLRRLPSGAVR